MAEAICNRCIHHDICDAYTGEETITFFPYNEDCEHFKSKDDVVEVRRGEWETTDTPLGRCCICSVCGSCPTMEYRYCPYCGAKNG